MFVFPLASRWWLKRIQRACRWVGWTVTYFLCLTNAQAARRPSFSPLWSAAKAPNEQTMLTVKAEVE